MKKLLFLLLSLTPFISTPVYASQTVQIPVEANTEISLIHEGEVKERKNIKEKDVFDIELDGIGKYEYVFTDGTVSINTDVYVTNDGVSFVSYKDNEKLDSISFEAPVVQTESVETETTTVNVSPKQVYSERTGDVSYTPVWIIVGVCTGAGIGISVYFIRKRGNKL